MLAIPAIVALVSAVVLGVLFAAIVVGAKEPHPTDLSMQRPARSAALARWALALHVQRGAPRADSVADDN